MDEQIVAAIIRGDKSKSLFRVKPFYYTCTHLRTPSAFQGAVKFVSHIFLKRIFLRDVRICPLCRYYTRMPVRGSTKIN
jgi:hypothetical protein